MCRPRPGGRGDRKDQRANRALTPQVVITCDDKGPYQHPGPRARQPDAPGRGGRRRHPGQAVPVYRPRQQLGLASASGNNPRCAGRIAQPLPRPAPRPWPRPVRLAPPRELGTSPAPPLRPRTGLAHEPRTTTLASTPLVLYLVWADAAGGLAALDQPAHRVVGVLLLGVPGGPRHQGKPQGQAQHDDHDDHDDPRSCFLTSPISLPVGTPVLAKRRPTRRVPEYLRVDRPARGREPGHRRSPRRRGEP